jgi:hypothetical protein
MKVLDNPVNGERIVLPPADGGGEAPFRCEIFMHRGGGSPMPHVHARQEERVRVLSGTATYLLRRRRGRLSAGEELVIPAGVPHRIWNQDEEELHAELEFRPGLDSAVFFERLFGLAAAGSTNAAGVPRLVDRVLLAHEHQVFAAGAPVALQRAVVAALAPLARRLAAPPAGAYAPAVSGRADFERLVHETAYLPATPTEVVADLRRQLAYQPDGSEDGLEALGPALLRALGWDPAGALPELRRVAAEHPAQPLAQFYALAVARAAGDVAAVEEALAALERADPGDPVVELFGLELAGKPIPGITDEERLANIAKFARTPLLRDPYQLAMRTVFEAIRDQQHARVLDVGVGSGSQLCELLRLLADEEHRVRRLELVGLDLVPEYLRASVEAIHARARELAGQVDVAYEPVEGRIEACDAALLARLAGERGVDAVNATIVLHEVPGEAKLAALDAVRRLRPGRFVIAEWDFCLENVLPSTSVRFLWGVRRVVAAMVGAVRELYPLEEGRKVAHNWLSLAGGQLTSPASERQECFLEVATWKALLARSGFELTSPVVPGPITVLEAAPRRVDR